MAKGVLGDGLSNTYRTISFLVDKWPTEVKVFLETDVSSHSVRLLDISCVSRQVT